MSDRELLELAAKAAGIEDLGAYGHMTGRDWNPLTNDGDALRLAVKLGFQLDLRDPATRTFGAPSGAIDEHHRKDPYTATRRAIVRAAAEIGRTM